MTRDLDILIVGGGLAGAALACALAQSTDQLSLALVEPNPHPQEWTPAPASIDDFDLRVSALTPASQQFLQALDIWPRMAAQRVAPYRGMQVWDAEGTGRIQFDAANLHIPALGHIVENAITLTALWQRLRELKVVHLQDRVQAIMDPTAKRPEVRLASGETLRARLLVAADGAESRIRSLASFPTREWDYEQLAMVATVKTSFSHQQTAWQRFLSTGPLAFLPLWDGLGDHYSSIVWTQSLEEGRRLQNLPTAVFAQELTAAFEGELGDVEAVSRRASFPLRQRHAKDYVKGSILLMGDAAHSIHPLAGQGINLGFLDVAVLADEILRALGRGLDFADASVLQRYQRRRKGHNLAMMGAMEGFKRLFGADPLPLRWARNLGMRWLDGLPVLKNQVALAATGTDQLPERWRAQFRPIISAPGFPV